MLALNCLTPTVEPKATDYIPEMVSMIEQLVKSNHAYEADGSVWFAVESFEAYGRLSGRSLVGLLKHSGFCTLPDSAALLTM